ncbi:MAG TPA: amidohydrolase [Steroidobacteraceae bacterium]|nr:amidohydrolase [Steroidobacteraceae bacterium]
MLAHTTTVARVLLSVAFALTYRPVAAQSPSGQPADLILEHAAVFTPNGWAEAVAVRAERVVAVGPDAEMEKLRSASTRTIDLQGRIVFPGLIDMHVHPLIAARRTLTGCHFNPGPPAQIIAVVADCARSRAKGDWIVGGQFGQGFVPTKQMLDAVSPDNPVVLLDVSGHNAWANSKALALAGITQSTQNPPGGVIERDAVGEPSGLLRETAAAVFARLIPPPTRAQNAHDLELALHLLLSFGVTSFTDAAATRAELQAYDDLADGAKLKQRVRACILWEPESQKVPGIVDPLQEGRKFARERVSPSCVKFILDGIPGPGRTAAFIDPYEPAPGRPKDEHGSLMIPPDVLNSAVVRFDKAGLTTKFHATGDAAAREGLDAIEAARRANGPNGPRHEIAHANFVQPSDIERAKRIRATLEFSPAIWGGGDRASVGPMVAALGLGLARMERGWPVKEALDVGVMAVGGTDWPTAPTPNVWPAIETLVTRLRPGITGEPVMARERITLEQAIDLYTINAARQLGTETQEGSIEVGKRADLIVLDKNPFRIPIEQVHAVKVELTLIDGHVVYDSSAVRE